MIDFRRLLDEDPAERDARRERQETERRERAIRDDIARRETCVRMTILVVLSEDAEHRFTRGGAQQIILRGTDDTGVAVVAVYWVPHYHQDDIQMICKPLGSGASVALAGFWDHREWRDRAGRPHMTTEFQTQFIRDPKTIAPDAPQDLPEPPWSSG
ncbi:hypothetical protein FHS96_005756 [Sphingomonas zeicaulis]|uniref:hypothetical protein n=1 Tax=Sphingomonas zeicaulis TaxID=1632740 RepID=UPI003D20D3F2